MALDLQPVAPQLDLQPAASKLDLQPLPTSPVTDLQSSPKLDLQPVTSKLDLQPAGPKPDKSFKGFVHAVGEDLGNIGKGIMDTVKLPGKVLFGESGMNKEQLESGATGVATLALGGAPTKLAAGKILPKVEEGAVAAEKATPPVVHNVADDLFQNANMKTKDEIEMSQKLKTIQGIPPATFEKLQAYEESGKKLPLTPEEQQIYDTHFEPIARESKEHVEYLKSKGNNDYELGDENYTPRQVKGSGSPTDRILDRGEATKATKGKSISTFASATKGRSFFAVDTPAGRQVVYADKDGQIFPATIEEGKERVPIGFIDKGEKASAGGTAEILGKPTTLQTAKIPEIEAATKGGIEYHKNLLGTRVTNLMQLRRARRNTEMIERWKGDPEFAEQVRWKGASETPQDFRYVNGLPREFEGAKFSPALAEQLEDFLPRVKNDDALSKVEKVGRLTRASIFFWPITHMGNITYQYGMSKGLAGLANPLKLPSTVKNLASGFRAVATQNKEYMKYLGEGASLPYANEVAKQFPDELMRAMQGEVSRNPTGMQAIAKAFGYGNPVQMVKNIYAASNKALWSYGDALAIARIKDLEATGLSTKEAIKEAETVMPSYRVPSRVAGQRWLSQGLQNPLTAEFGRYQYNVLRSFAETWNKIKDPATRAKGLDQAAFVAFMAAVGYPLLDKLAQKVTSNPNAEFKKSGAGKVLQNALDVPEGKKNVRQAIMSSASPGMLTAPVEALMNTNLYTGGKIYNDQDLQQGHLGRVGSDLAGFAAGQVGPVQQGMNAAAGKSDAERFLEGLFMIQNPTPAQVNARQKAQNFLLKQQGRDVNKRGF